MGFLSRLTRPNDNQSATAVTVAFRDITAHDPLTGAAPDSGYGYLWPFPQPPRVGDWAVAPGIDGPATVVVVALQAPVSARGLKLKPLLQAILPEEVARARAGRDAAAHTRLDYARQVAGLPEAPTVQSAPPAGYDPLPPAHGSAAPQTAQEYGQRWWEAYKLAERLGRPAGEVAAFKSVGQAWFKQRDAAAKADRDQRMTSTLATTDLQAAIRNVSDRTRADVEQMLFAGQPLWDWLTHVQDLEKQGRLDEALELVGALITAAEQEAQLSGREPAPGYTERAAIIYRKRRDYAGEIAVIERWERACPPERRGPGATQAKLAKRLQRARQLAANG
jgi:hypothetical protein